MIRIRKKAFTLVEVLVVISVVSLLMAIMLPSLGRARGLGRGLLCRSNLRQLAIAAQMYAQTYDEYYPFAYVFEMQGTKYIQRDWDFAAVTEGSETTIEPGLLWGDGMAEKIQQCPSYDGTANWDRDPYTGYNYNASFIGGSAAVVDGRPVPGTVVKSVRASAVRRAAKCAIFGDGQYTAGPNKYMRAPFEGTLDGGFWGRYAGAQGYRHLEKTNVAYCDGSVRAVAKLFDQTDSAGKKELQKHNEHAAVKVGFLSADNSVYDTSRR